tara:strand:+ start:1933 stop:3051 length:1119 start_codon:yes stop_codon:yes gene_type:complete
MSKINTRSPYYITITSSKLSSVNFDIWIYTGTKITDRTSGNLFRLSSTAIANTVTVEISELVSDYILSSFNGVYDSEIVWVDYRSQSVISGSAQAYTTFTTLKGFNGYGFFEDGANPQNLQSLLQSNTTILKPDDSPVVLAVDSSITTSVAFYANNEQLYTQLISPSFIAKQQIKYVSNSVNGVDTFEERVLSFNGTFENNLCIQEFLDDFTIFPVDTIYINGTNGVDIIKVENIQECKYQPYKLTFINKFGVLQSIWFFKRTNETLTTKKEDFKRNIVVNGSYDTSRHQQKVLTKNGNEKLTLNTGYYPESYNDVFKQMQLSEDNWIEINNKTLPINVSGSSLAFKTQLNDKLINYTVEIEFAYDTINNIR